MGAGKLADQVKIPQDQIGFRGDADADPGVQQLLQEGAGASVFFLQRLVRVGDRAEEGLLACVFSRLVDLRPGLDVHKLAPGLRVVGKALHEGGIAVFAGVGAAHVGIDGVIRHRQVCLC